MRILSVVLLTFFVVTTAQAVEVGETLRFSQDAFVCRDVPATGGGFGAYCYGYGYNCPDVPAHATISVPLNQDGVTALTARTTSCADFHAQYADKVVSGTVIQKNVKLLGPVKVVYLSVRLGPSGGLVLNGYGEI